MSVTLAVQLVETPTGVDAGEHVNDVEVVRAETERLEVPELREWSGSPP
jgi:hypothetical protein